MKDDVIFTVALDDVKLSKAQLTRLDKGIRDVVMKHIARIDHGGEIAINRKLDENPKLLGPFLPLGPIIFGIWISTIADWLDRIGKTKPKTKANAGIRALGDDNILAVSLDGIKMPKQQIEAINNEIQDVVMREIASIDHRGDLIISNKLSANPRLKGWEWVNRTWGIWVINGKRYYEIFR